MPSHRRAVLGLLATAIAVVATLSVGASAAGPGGWDHLADGGTPGVRSLNGSVRAFAGVPGTLYVGGAFTDAGGKADADRIATWNGSAWGALGPAGLNGDVMAITYHAGKVFAGGTFTNAGGSADADYLAVWDGVSWAKFCDAPGAPFNGNVTALQIIGSTLYVGGSFLDGGGIASADGLLACDLNNNGASSSPVAGPGDMSGGVYALAADSNGVLYAGGTFIKQGNDPAADYVARWNGAAWSSMGTGASPGGGAVTGIVRSLTANGTDVYVGSDASDIALIAQADHVARWNGTDWFALGANTSGNDGWLPTSTSINGMTTSGSNVFVTGAFQNANGDPRADVVAQFDGAAWHPVGSNGAGDGPLNASAHALAIFDGRLYAGGSFTSAGGDTNAWFAASYQLAGPPVPTPTQTPPPAPVPTPTVTPAPPPPPPTLGETVNAQVQAGTVLVELPAKKAARATKFIPLTEARQLPLGSTFDTTRGTVRLTLAGKQRGSTQTGTFSKGRFKTAQSKRDALTTLTVTGGSRTACKAKRSLVSRVQGRFRTLGRYSSATGRGSTWTQTDTCAGTLTVVKSGSVVVRDAAKRRNVVVKKGKRYLARARRR